MNLILVPIWVKIIVGVLAVANIYFGILGYFSNKPLFENSTVGIDLAGSGAKFASFEFATRNLSIGLALLLSALLGIPVAIAIILIVRILIELQSLVISIAIRKFGAGFIIPIVFLVVEVFIVKTVLGL